MYPENLPLRDNLRAAHIKSWQRIAAPGAFLTGAQRVAILSASRSALFCDLCKERNAALSPNAVTGSHFVENPMEAELPDEMIDIAHRMVTDPGRLTQGWFEATLAAGASWGLTKQTHVEIVSVVATGVIVDTLHKSLGLTPPALPAPLDGLPTGIDNPKAIDGGAWVPILAVPPGPENAANLPAIPNIVRSLGLVPAAGELFFGAFQPHYALSNIPLSISQAQSEFVAARVSSLNECFY